MKTKFIFLLSALFLLCSCKSHYKMGWYEIADNQIVGKVLFEPKDFSKIHLDSISAGDKQYVFLSGTISPAKRMDWTNTTERLIGKQLGFVYKDSVVVAPQINCKIESGSFQINSDDAELLRDIQKDILSQMK